MQHTWQLQEAKNRFSELVELSLTEGPQIVTCHGKPVVQIVPLDASGRIKRLTRKSPQTNFGQHFMRLLDLPQGPELELPERSSRKDISVFE